MSPFLSFIRKEFFHIFRDRRTLLILLGMPVMQIVLFGFAITTEVNHCRVAIVAPSYTGMVRQLADRLDANRYFSVIGRLGSVASVDSLFLRNKADLILVIPDHLESDLSNGRQTSVQIIADATDPNTSSMMVAYMQGVLESAFSNRENRQVRIETRLLYNPQMKSAYNFVPGVMGLILMLICTMMTSISIVREKETGTMEVLLVSPVHPFYIILAKAIPYFLLSCVNLLTILLLSVHVLQVPVSGSLVWLLLLSAIFITVSLSLGLLISTIVSSQVAAMLISGMAMLMPALVLSGMIFPIESMPVVLQWMACIIPARWYIEAVRKVMIEGLGGMYIVRELLILSAMAVVLVTLSLNKFKNRLE